MSDERIVTLFDNAEHARAAERNLIKAGFDEDDISLIEASHLRKDEKGEIVIKDPSIWNRLFGDDLDDEWAEVYTNAIRNNGVVLSIEIDEEDQPKALGILNRHQLVDVPARVHGAETSGLTNANSSVQQPSNVTALPGQTLTENYADNTSTRPFLTGNEDKEEILRLAKEELEVGKRLVKEGTTKIRRYVTKENVSKTIKLREQHAEVLRRAVDRPTDGTDIDWDEKTIEVDEMVEKPVINKTAHVVEEVVVKKVNTDRDEKINETVRQQHVDIDRSNGELNKTESNLPPKRD